MEDRKDLVIKRKEKQNGMGKKKETQKETREVEGREVERKEGRKEG